MKKYNIYITPAGELEFLFYDELKGFLLDKSKVKRASHINPQKTNKGIRWFVDLSPLGIDKKLGPYKTRDIAIAKEIKWIEGNKYERRR